MEEQIEEARKIIRKELKKNKEYRQSCIEALSKIMFDDLPPYTEPDVRDKAAEKILEFLFSTC